MKDEEVNPVEAINEFHISFLKIIKREKLKPKKSQERVTAEDKPCQK